MVAFSKLAFSSTMLWSMVAAQQIGTELAETHPSISYETCDGAGGCTSQPGEIVLDSNWRWVHNVGMFTPVSVDNMKNIC